MQQQTSKPATEQEVFKGFEGIVRKWDDAKGFGYIERPTGGRDVFVHFSEIRMKGHRRLEVGQRVKFDLVNTDKGPAAHNVFVINPRDSEA